MKKRFLSFILALSMLFVVVGCKENPTDSGSADYESEMESSVLLQGDEDIASQPSTDVSSSDNSQGTTSSDKVTSGGSNVTASSSAGNNSQGTASSNKVTGGGANVTVPSYLKGTKVKMLIWYQIPDEEKALITKFEKETGIKVEYEASSEFVSEYTKLIATHIAAGDGFDVCMIPKNRFPQFTQDYLQPINRIKGKNGKAVFSTKDPIWNKQISDAFTVDGKIYAVNIKNNWQYDYVGMFYNETMFKQRGVKTPGEYYAENNWNWKTFLDCAQKMTFTNNGKNVWGYTEETVNYRYIWPMSAGVDYVTFDGSEYKNNITNPKVVKALQFASDLTYKYKVMNPAMPHGVQEFAKGNAAMISVITYVMKKSAATNWDEMSDTVKVVPFPNESSSTNYMPVMIKGFGVMNKAQNPEGAVYWIRYWQNPKNYAMSSMFINKNFEEMFYKFGNMNEVYPYSTGLMDYAGYLGSDKLNNQIALTESSQMLSKLESYKNSLDQSCQKANNLFE